MDYLEKIEKNPYKDLFWNIPEGQKLGKVAVIGGNAQSFRSPIKISEFLLKEYPFEVVKTVLPSSLKNKLPPLPNLLFLKDTESGSFCDGTELTKAIDAVDYSLIIGDLSKNSITIQEIKKAARDSQKPLILARDTLDLIVGDENLLMRDSLTVIGSIVQWQKIFRGVYYPKILQPSQSLVQIVEAIHKFTLSYPLELITLHEEQIVVAKDGKLKLIPLSATSFLPFTIWGGELAARILALSLYNPGKTLEATVAGIIGA